MTAAEPSPIESPRLRAFLERASGRPDAQIAEQWAKFAAEGFPLQERIPGETRRLRVTFLWRPAKRLRSASLYTPIANPLNGESRLQPLGETGVWYRSFVLPRRARALYAFSPLPQPGPTPGGDWGTYFRSLREDPHNPSFLTVARDPDDPEDVAANVSVVALPSAPPQPWTRVRAPLRWKVDHEHLRSASLVGSRSVWVYTPVGFDPKRTKYNLVVGLDGVAYQSIVPSPSILEYLVDKGRVGPSILVLVGNAVGARDRELLHHPGYVRFLATEVVPWLRRRYHLTVPAARCVITGSSLGGLTAAYAALVYPGVFGNVLAQSGAFSWSDSGGTLGSPTLMEEYARAPRRATRFYLDAGSMETTVLPGTQLSILAGVRHLRDVLRARGYSVEYAEFEGGHDYACWGNTLSDGLERLVGRRAIGS